MSESGRRVSFRELRPIGPCVVLRLPEHRGPRDFGSRPAALGAELRSQYCSFRHCVSMRVNAPFTTSFELACTFAYKNVCRGAPAGVSSLTDPLTQKPT